MRDLLRRFGLLPPGRGGVRGSAETMVVYVRCAHCGEIVHVRIDPQRDAAQEFDNGVTGYTLRKEILGVMCNRVIRVEMTLDRHYAVTAKRIDGGRFATREDYEAYKASPARHRGCP